MKTADCPPAERLTDLLDGRGSDEVQASLVRHLDTCEDCQSTLEQLAVGDAPLPKHGVASPAPLAGDSAFWPAVSQLEHRPFAETMLTPSTDSSGNHGSAAGSDAVRTLAPGQSDAHDKYGLDFLEPSESPGSLGRLADFDVIEVIGQGGMGTVVKAFDNCLHRYVAIKIVRNIGTGGNVCQRFMREVRSAASIRHDNVVPIYTVDETHGRPYLVMEYVPGKSLEQHLSISGALELKEILRVASQTARGLAAAHAQGVVHRDIKPANLLLDGKEKVKITDFGLARAAEDGRITQTGLVMGTPQYMAPEQAQGHAVDQRADLFSLGSVIYAMATGQAPFDASSTMATLLAVVKDQPRSIRELNPAIPQWLVEVVEKLHAKDPADRFQTASELADLLGQHLCHLKMPDRVPAPQTTTTLNRSLASSVAGWFGGLLGRPANDRRTPPSGSTPVEEVASPVRATLDAGTGPIWSLAISPDDRTLAMALDDGTFKLWDAAARRVRGTLAGHRAPVWSVQFSPTGNVLATASDDGYVRLWDVTSGKELRFIKHATSVRTVAFSPDGKRLVTGSRDGAVRIFDEATGEELITTLGHGGVVVNVAYSPDGQSIVSAGGDKTARVWNADNGLEQLVLSGHAGGVYAVAFSPDSNRIATGSWDKTVGLWDAGTGTRLATLAGHTQDVWTVAFSPNGRFLASGSEDRTVRLWDVNSGASVNTYRGHSGTVYNVIFSHDGHLLISGGRDGTARLWDVER